MKIEERTIADPTPPKEYVITLSPHEAKVLRAIVGGFAEVNNSVTYDHASVRRCFPSLAYSDYSNLRRKLYEQLDQFIHIEQC